LVAEAGVHVDAGGEGDELENVASVEERFSVVMELMTSPRVEEAVSRSGVSAFTSTVSETAPTWRVRPTRDYFLKPLASAVRR